MAADVRDWLRTRSQGGPRSRPRDEHTVRMNLNRVHPLLLDWAGHYIHLREVTAADVTAATGPLPPTRRRQTLTALRSLFGHAKKTGTIFRDPTRGVRDGQRPLILIQPLQPAEIDQATSAAVTPAARLAVALAAIHAARPKTIRELHLGDVDLGNRRLVITGRARPLDDLTRSLLLAWLQHRGRRWPGTANPHLIINQQTAMTTRAVSENWLTGSCRGLTATLERLRVDRQLEEALTCGADPLHLAAVFGIDDTTAIKYATIARQLLADRRRTARPLRLPRTQGPGPPIEREDPSVPAADPSVRANSGQSASPLPHPACPSQGTGRSTCLSRWSAAAGGGCWFRGPGGRDVAAAVAVARHGDAGGAGEHDPLGEPPALPQKRRFISVIPSRCLPSYLRRVQRISRPHAWWSTAPNTALDTPCRK